MKAIILAAGEGKRLRPLTSDKPKALVEIWGKTLLQRQLDQLEKLGIDDVCIVTGYRKDQIEKLGRPTAFNESYATTNMVYSLTKALPNLKASTSNEVLILYGDIAYREEHLAQLICAPLQSPMIVLGNIEWYELWRQRLEDPFTDAETFIYDEHHYLKEIGQKPHSMEQVQAQYMGMIKVDKTYLEKILYRYLDQATNDKIKNLYLTDLIQQAIQQDNSVRVELVSGSWIEIDTIEDYDLYSGKSPDQFGLAM